MSETGSSMAESSQQTRFIIGYALAPKKQQSLMQPSLINRAKERGVDLIKIENETELINQGSFDCIIHKIYSEDWKRQLRDFQFANPNVVIIDSPEATERLHNRIPILQAVSEVLQSTPTFGIAKQIVVFDAPTLANPSSWESLKFPVIAKPLVSDPESNKLSLSYNHTELKILKPPVVLQEFVSHGGVIFKVSVAGKHVQSIERKLEMPIDMREDGAEITPPDPLIITAISKRLRESLKLNMFSFLVVRDTSVENRYHVIDINYFPGYSKLTSYESMLTNFFCDLAAAYKDEELEPGMTSTFSFRHRERKATPV